MREILIRRGDDGSAGIFRCVYEREYIHSVKSDASQRASVFGGNKIAGRCPTAVQ